MDFFDGIANEQRNSFRERVMRIVNSSAVREDYVPTEKLINQIVNFFLNNNAAMNKLTEEFGYEDDSFSEVYKFEAAVEILAAFISYEDSLPVADKKVGEQ